MSANDDIRVQQQGAVVQTGGLAGLSVSQLGAIVQGGRAAEYGFVHNQGVVANTGGAENRSVLRVQQLGVIVNGAEGDIPEGVLEARAFPYDIDGHIFYGLHVNGKGTYLLDLTTRQWTLWRSGDLTLWNAQYHVRWNGEYYAGSVIDNSVVKIDPESVLDDSFRDNTFRVTGRIEYQNRRFVQNPEAQIFGSIGDRGGEVTLRYSNDEGETWSADRTVSVTAGMRDDNVLFYDMGSVRAPGRIYQIEDKGALRRIQSLRVKLGSGDGEAS